MSLRRGGLHQNLPGPNAEGLAWNHIRQVYSAMGPAHLSASSPGRVAASLLALAPNLAAHPSLPRTGRRCGREGHLGPLGASLCVLTEHAMCPQDRAPSTWVRGNGAEGDVGLWKVAPSRMALACHGQTRPLKSQASLQLLAWVLGFGVRELGDPRVRVQVLALPLPSRASSARDFTPLSSFPVWSWN